MKKLILMLLLPISVTIAVAVAASGSAASSHRSVAQPVSASPAVAATNRLALDLLPRLGGAGNVVFSPYSIAAALAMADQGAARETATQIGHVLGSSNGAALGAGEAALAARLRAAITPPPSAPATDTARLLIANGLWVNSGLALESPFQDALAQDFGATPQPLDFGSQPDAARQAINAWVAQHTAQLIKNLMPPGSITAQTALMLANAIYLKAHWASPFIKSSTVPRRFTIAAGQSVRTPFMTQPPATFAYAHGAGFQAIDLPYLDSTLSMLAVMPSAGALTQFERRMTVARLRRITGSLSSTLVRLRMPRFQLALHASLVPALSALGMPIAFTDAADFSGITSSTGLKIQAVEHGATLKADEQGTVAAAATGIALEPTAIRGGPSLTVTLDHPFLLFLRDDATGAILFAARVTDPTRS